MRECMPQEDAMYMSNEQAVQILKPLHDMMIDQHGCPISDAVFALEKAMDALTFSNVKCCKCEFWDRETVRQNSNDVARWNEAICIKHSVDGNEPHEFWTDADWYCADGSKKDGET